MYCDARRCAPTEKSILTSNSLARWLTFSYINGPEEAYGKFGADSVKAEPCMLIADEVGPRGIF